MSVATTSAAIQVQSEFNFDVVKLPMVAKHDGQLLESDDFGLYRNDTWKQVHSRPVKAIYNHHTTGQVVKMVEVAESIFDECEVRFYFNRGHYVQLTPSRQYRQAIYGTVDNVFPTLLIRAPYDLNAIYGSLGFYRDACMNMAELQSVVSTSLRIPHLSNLEDDIEILTNSFSTLKESWGDMTAFIGKMQATRVNMEAFIIEVFGECPNIEDEDATQRKVNNWTERRSAIIRRVSGESVMTGRGLYSGNVSVWEAYNGVQGYYQHDAPRMGQRFTLARVLKTSASPHVRAAEQVAKRLVTEAFPG